METLDFTDMHAVETLFNEAFQHPEQTYIVQPVDVQIAAQWLSEFTSMVNFTWSAGTKSFEQRLQQAGPMRFEQLIHLDELFYRNRCGWAARSYHCDHPDHADAELCAENDCEECTTLGNDEQGQPRRKCLCFASGCPIAAQADREDMKRLDPDLWESDYKDSEYEPEEWMILPSRPRYAYVPNITVLGCEHVRRC